MNKHSSGPWSVSPYDNVMSKSGTIAKIEQMPGNDEAERKANARLIASAPALLSAARNAANVLAAIATRQLDAIKPNSKALQELRDAIKQAEGNTI